MSIPFQNDPKLQHDWALGIARWHARAYSMIVDQSTWHFISIK
jgi:hypothetical protein